MNCSSLFKCQNQTKCLHLSDVCNKNRDCLLGDDELLCHFFVCPTECKCFAQGAICQDLNINSITDSWLTVKYLKCYNCQIQFHNHFFRLFDTVLILSVKRFQSPYICINTDRSNGNVLGLRHLDVSFNKLRLLKNFCLVSLKSLIILNLHKNSISAVEEKSFLSLLSLQLLDLSCNKVTKLKGLLFDSLENIKILNLTNNPVIFVSADPFRNIPSNTVHSLNTKICCMSGLWTKCRVNNDADSNCDSLLSQKFIKYFCWAVGIVAIFLNLVSISVHIQTKKANIQMNSVSMLPLSVVDGLYGIYLTSIAIVDLHFGGNYVGHEIIWRRSFMCKISSFLALVSMLSSPVIIALMMMARYCITRWAMTSNFLKQTFIRNCILIILTVSVTFSVLVSSAFGFLEKSFPTGICLPLGTSGERSPFLLVVTWTVTFVQISCCFLVFTFSFLFIRTLIMSSRGIALKRKQVKYQKFALNSILVTFTKLCCWIPSSVVFILPVTKYSVANSILTWVTVGVIPINSVLNPLIFTLLTPNMIRIVSKMCSTMQNKWSSFRTDMFKKSV